MKLIFDPCGISVYEWDMIYTALEERKKDLEEYRGWIDDHPELPKTKVALDRIAEDEKKIQKLIYFIATGWRP